MIIGVKSRQGVSIIMKIRIIIRLLLNLSALSAAGYLIKLGFDYKDVFYYFLAALIFFILTGGFVKKERLLQLDLPRIRLKINFLDFFKKITELKLLKQKKVTLAKKVFRGIVISRFVVLAIVSVFLSYLTVFKLPDNTQEKNFIINLIKSLIAYSYKHSLLLILLASMLVVFNFITSLKLGKKRNIINALLYSAFIFIIEVIISIPVSLVLVLLFVLIFYNSLITVSNYYPKLLDIHTDKNEIRQIIDKSYTNFELVGISETSSKTFVTSSPFLGRKGNFFTKNFIASLPKFAFLNSRTINHPVYLIRNTLVIKELDKEIFQTFAPTFIKKLVKRDLSPRYIKDEPDVEIISRQDYLKYREDEINKQIDVISGYINESKKYLRAIAYDIQVAKSNIASLQNNIALNIQYRDEEYNRCISETWTYYGYYSNYTYRLYTDTYCQSQRSQRDQQNEQYQSEISTNQRILSSYQSQYNQLKEYLDKFQNYKAFVEETKKLTPYELGLFEPDKSVKVVLDSVSDKDISNFLETLTHEYIHYSSYVSKERSLPQFFEEGITEYLARKVISNQLHKSVNLGYPVVVKIISVMVEKIPVAQFEDIYFNKSADQLESLLDQTYGKDFYKDTQLYFALIPYSPPDEALKFANNIMFKIGGPELTGKDLESTY